MKRRKRLPPLDDNPVFQDLLKDLRRQTPDQLDRLQTMLDKRIHDRGTNDRNSDMSTSADN